MDDKFQNKYRIPSARLHEYDYASQGAYFITICTQNRECYFGEIQNEEMYLNELGKIVEQEWLKTPILRSDMNLELGEFVVMPNHFHAVIFIGQNEYNAITEGAEMRCLAFLQKGNDFKPQSKNLASIIRGFKSAVTMYARKKDIPFFWQSRYYDRIIRDYTELNTISQYIKNNPANWQNDEYR